MERGEGTWVRGRERGGRRAGRGPSPAPGRRGTVRAERIELGALRGGAMESVHPVRGRASPVAGGGPMQAGLSGARGAGCLQPDAVEPWDLGR